MFSLYRSLCLCAYVFWSRKEEEKKKERKKKKRRRRKGSSIGETTSVFDKRNSCLSFRFSFLLTLYLFFFFYFFLVSFLVHMTLPYRKYFLFESKQPQLFVHTYAYLRYTQYKYIYIYIGYIRYIRYSMQAMRFHRIGTRP